MRKDALIIPFIILFANIAVFFPTPFLFRGIIIFIFLSFIPGYTILRLFKLKEITFLETILLSVALSITFVMSVVLLINELYLFVGLSQPLSVIPIILTISVSTLVLFSLGYRNDLPETLNLSTNLKVKLKDILPISLMLFLLPLLTIIGVFSQSLFLVLISDIIIAILCVMSVMFRKLVPEKLFPFLIFSISIALVCQVLLTSKYVIGIDSNLEYYVFRLTQINGHWAFPNAIVNPLVTLTYNSMLSITLLPAAYSVLMQTQSDIIFKILPPFIFLLVPLTLYQICEKQFGKLIGLLSALFFVFTNFAFYGEPLGINRQIIGEFFFIISVLLLINKSIPFAKRSWLLVIFGAALAVSHYSLAFVYLFFIAIIFIISRLKQVFKDTLDAKTVLILFAITFSWYSIGPSAPLLTLGLSFRGIFERLTGVLPILGGTAGNMFGIPNVFTAASWINLFFSGIVNLSLIVGVLLITLRAKSTGILGVYRVMSIVAAMLLFTTFLIPEIAVGLNFTRFYGITMLFLSPCVIFGSQALLKTMGKAWMKIKRPIKRQIIQKNKNIELSFMLIAIILCGYFLSQVGFVNTVTNGAIHTYNSDFYRMKESNDIKAKNILYSWSIPEQDVFSASWLLNHKVENAMVFTDFADALSGSHVLISYGLIPSGLLFPMTNTTIPPQGSFVFLGSFNIVTGLMANTTGGSFNTSDLSTFLNQQNLVYSNENSIVWKISGPG